MEKETSRAPAGQAVSFVDSSETPSRLQAREAEASSSSGAAKRTATVRTAGRAEVSSRFPSGMRTETVPPCSVRKESGEVYQKAASGTVNRISRTSKAATGFNAFNGFRSFRPASPDPCHFTMAGAGKTRGGRPGTAGAGLTGTAGNLIIKGLVGIFSGNDLKNAEAGGR